MRTQSIILLLSLMIFSCAEKESADTVLLNGKIYTVNSATDVVEAVAIKDKKIWRIGSTEEIKNFVGEATNTIDLEGKPTYPGLIEGHAHIMGVGQNLINVDLMGTKSYQELIDMVAERARNTPEGEWIIGRG